MDVECNQSESIMANLSIKNVPEIIMEGLRTQAKRHHRSLQGELIAILEEAVQPKRLMVADVHRIVAESGVQTERLNHDDGEPDAGSNLDQALSPLKAVGSSIPRSISWSGALRPNKASANAKHPGGPCLASGVLRGS